MKHVVKQDGSLFSLMEGTTTVPYQTHSRTSRLAAGAVKHKAPSQKQQIHDHILSRATFGVADHEGIRDLASQITSISNTYRARRTELAKDGLIKKRAKGRVTPAGLEADVWIGAKVVDVTGENHETVA